MAFEQPKLKYAFDALEPSIDKETMKFLQSITQDILKIKCCCRRNRFRR